MNSQEIIERSIYTSILKVLIDNGLTLDPAEYYPISDNNSKRYKQDRATITQTKGFYVDLFGTGNSYSKGSKVCPRIVIESNGFYPGEIGLPLNTIEKLDDGFVVTEQPFEVIDQFIDVILVYNVVEHGRLLNRLLNTAIPQRGYIKPYIYSNKPFDGNIFMVLSNFYKNDNVNEGLMERVYQFTIKDTLLEEPKVIDNVVPINYVEVLINKSLKLNINK